MSLAQMLGKYEIRGTLGRGAMGTVYDGWDPQIARRVAIKTVPLPEDPDPETAEEIARFKREAQAAGRLAHPNIVGVYDYGETADMAYIVMEFVDGPSLKALLDKQERFALPALRRVMEELLAGLQFSHARGVVHRDIKPANIMLTSEGQAKIADFGIARIEMSSMTQAGTMLGTPAYMSPEQFMGQVADARTDVYSAGVVLYQLLTGEKPFDGGLTAIMHKALNTEPPPPSQLAVTAPSALDAVVRQAMAKRPDDRYPSAAAFAEAIRIALSEPPADADRTMIGAAPARPAAPIATPAAVPRPQAAPPAAPARSRTLPLIGAAVAAVLVLAGGGWFLLRPAALPTAAPVKIATAEPASAPVAVASPPAETPAPIQPAPAAEIVPAPAPAPIVAAPPPVVPPPAPIPAAVKPAPAPVVQPSSPPPPRAEIQPAPLPPVQPKPAETQPKPAEPQLADAGMAPLRQQIATALSGASCALTDAVVQDDGRIGVSGLAGSDGAAALRQRISGLAAGHPLDWRVQAIDPVFCSTLGLLRPIAATPAGLGLALANGRTALHDGERILPRVVAPSFGGELRVDYLGHDGSVVHLYPTEADPAQHVAAQPDHRFAPGERLALGDGGPGRPVWEVGPPYGTDMIIAVAASVKLPAASQNAEDNAAAYLRSLDAAIAEARRQGAQVVGTALLVDTLSK